MLLTQDIRDNKFRELSELVLERDIVCNEIECVHTSDHYPDRMKLALLTDVDCGDMEVLGAARDFVADVKENYDLDCHLCVYYPKDGYIDWHTNENIQTYNAICTYSEEGKSFFEYKDEETKRIQDKAGWTVKMTQWSKENPIWHRAVANDQRITVTFSSRDRLKVEKFIEDIT